MTDAALTDIGAGRRRIAGTARLAAMAIAAAALAALAGSLAFNSDDGKVGAIVMAASLVSSVAGFAFSAVGGAMLFHVSDDSVRLVQIMMTCSLANHAAMTWTIRRSIRWRAVARSLAGGLFGLPLGVAMLLAADRRSYLVAFGLFLIGYGVLLLLRRPAVRRGSGIVDALAGFAGGVTGGVAAFPSASVAVWAGMQGLTKEEQRGTFQPFAMTMQVAGLVAIALARGGPAVERYDWRLLAFVPAALAGTAVGLRLYRRMSDAHFRLAVTGLLIAAGLSYLV